MQKNLPAKKVHLRYLDSLRGLAALTVVVHHALLQFDFSGAQLGASQKWLLFAFQNGHYPVNFFIVLSGYCLMLPVLKSNYTLPGGALQFFKKRARRILPPYYFAMLLSLLLIALFVGTKTGTHWDVSIPVTKAGVVTHLLLLQDIFIETGANINHAFWSISVEWRIYFTFPVLLLLWRTVGPGRTVAAVAATVVALLGALKYLHRAYPSINNTPNGIDPHYLLLFALGMLGADIAFSNNSFAKHWKGWQWGAGLVLLTAAIVASANLPVRYAKVPWQFIDVLAGLWGVCLLLVCNAVQHSAAGRHETAKAVMSWKPLVAVGTFGYSLYLVHAPLLQVVSQYVLGPLHLPAFTGFVLLATAGPGVIVLFAYVFFQVCERPFMTRPQPQRALAVAAVAAV